MVDLGDHGGHCACGHSIRYGHPLHHKDEHERIVILGCVCVEHYDSLDPETAKRMRADFEAFKLRIQEAKREAKRLEQTNELSALITEWESVKDRVRELRAYYGNNGWVPNELFHVIYSRAFKRREYKSLAAALRHYRKSIDELRGSY